VPLAGEEVRGPPVEEPRPCSRGRGTGPSVAGRGAATMPPCCPRRPRHATRAALSSLCRGKHQMQVCLPRAHLSLPLSPSPDVATHGGCPWCGWAPAMARPTQGRSMAWRPLVLIFPFLPLSRCGHAWWLSPVRVDPAVPRSALRSLSNFSPH
jgi:hypothetical protein